MCKAWLKCEVKPGMFSDERVVQIAKVGGERTAYFVPSTAVQGDSVQVDVEHRGGIAWAILPTDHPYHAVPVPEADVSGCEE